MQAEPHDLAAPRLTDPRQIPVRFSALKNIARSPAHYRHACQRWDDANPLCRKLGTATHALAFEPHRVVVYQGGTWTRDVTSKGTGKTKTVTTRYSATRSGAYWKAFQKEHAGKVIVTPGEYKTASEMAEALQSDPLVRPFLFSPGLKLEKRIEWTIGGRKCAGTPDAFGLADGHGLVVPDLKTARTAEPERFMSAARWASYPAQATWYADALLELGHGWHAPMLIAIESTPPYPCVPFKLTERVIEMGRRQYMGWLERLKVCEDSNEWPGYVQAVADFDVPDEDPFTLTGTDGEEMELS